MSNLENRLNVLKQAGQIQEDSVTLANNIITLFQQDLAITLTEENAAMLITHVVMSNERIKNDQPVEALNEMIVEQMKKEDAYFKAIEVAQKVSELFPKFIEAERSYIEMHILNVIKDAV